MKAIVRCVGMAVLLSLAWMTLRAADTVHLRIGVIPFDAPKAGSATADPTEKSLRTYFDKVEQTSAFPVRIEIVKGNYYQILYWMRDGDLDGAVVSAFTAFLLTHDRQLSVFPAAEFLRPGDAQPGSGGQPAPIVMGATNKFQQLTAPLTTLDGCLQDVYKSLREPRPTQPCELRLVNHLSTTGFVLPLIYIDQFVNDQHLSPAEEKAFWARLLEWSRFEMWHGATPPFRPGIPTLRFSYKTPGRDGARLPFKSALTSPNDVLLLGCKRRVAADVGRDDDSRRTALLQESSRFKEMLMPSSNPRSVWMAAGSALSKLADDETAHGAKGKWLGYSATGAWCEECRENFAGSIVRLFDARTADDLMDGANKDTPLGALFRSWYQERGFAFTIDELVDLLAHDQVIRNAKSAALVLPGGGVRATYQSAILDSLYSRSIANVLDQRPGRLIINSIAGTSGGALLGYLAARRNSNVSTELTSAWIDHGKVKTKPSDVFPLFGVFRWISVLLVIAVFAATAAIHLQTLNVRPEQQVPFWYTTALTIVIVASPFLIWRNALRDPAYLTQWERVGFLCVLLTVHFFHSVSWKKSGVASGRRLWIGILMIVMGGLLGVSLSAHPFSRSGWWTLATTIVTVFVIGGLAVAVSAHGTSVRKKRVKAYLEALVVLLLLLALSSVFFLAGWGAGEVTSLEMTLAYWIWVFVAAAFASKLIVSAGRLYPRGPLQDGIAFLAAPSGTAPFPYTPTVTLVGWGAIGVASWLLFIAPALYSPDTAHDTFQAIQTKYKGRRELAPFVVSMTGFGSDVDGYKSYPGDYYACHFCGDIDPKQMSVGANVFRMQSDDDFQSAVFASGSPFPIFPAVPVPAEKRTKGLFVDGGYAHRVPIEAACVAQASQILVVENMARRDDAPVSDLHSYRVGALAANLGNAFNFLFDRSQELDVQAQKSAMVGTIYPDWTDPDPFLMDFREPVVRQLRREALGDLNGHRVGRIVSWGPPPQQR